MSKKLKLATTITLLLVVLVGVIAFVYLKFFAFSSQNYTTAKGQKYELSYYKDSELIDSAQLAEELDNDVKAGTPMLINYYKDDLGVAIYITDTLDKPITKTCTGTDRLAFTIDDYEVCKQDYDGKTVNLLAKLGKNGKYFMAVVSSVYDAKRITEDKDTAYTSSFQEFNILDHQKELEKIFRSITPIQ